MGGPKLLIKEGLPWWYGAGVIVAMDSAHDW